MAVSVTNGDGPESGHHTTYAQTVLSVRRCEHEQSFLEWTRRSCRRRIARRSHNHDSTSRIRIANVLADSKPPGRRRIYRMLGGHSEARRQEEIQRKLCRHERKRDEAVHMNITDEQKQILLREVRAGASIKIAASASARR